MLVEVVALIGFFVVSILSIMVYRLKVELRQQAYDFNKERGKIRKDAAFRSSAVNWGMTIENFVPFMDEFPVPPESVVFMGKPIDFVSFTDTEDPEKCKVHIIEVKSGKSQLLKHQRNIRDAVRAGRVEWHEVRVASNNKK